MAAMTTRITAMTVAPDDAPIYSEMATTIRIGDEGAGEFVEIEQGANGIRITPEEWPVIRDAIQQMINECRT